MNREVKQQLAEAFGLETESDVDALLAALRDDRDIDPRIVRKGCRVLMESLLESRSAKQESDERLDIALSASGLGFWTWDIAAGTVFFDSVLCGMLGLEAGGVVRQSAKLPSWMHPDDLETFRHATARALKGEVPLLHVRHRVLHTAGQWIWLETYGRVTQRDAAGRATRMTCTHIDITEHVNLERASANNLQVLQQLLETMPLPVIMRDTDRRVTMVNAALEKMLGVSRHDVIGTTPDSLAMPSSDARIFDSDHQVLSEQKPCQYEASWRTPAGDNFDVIVAKTPLISADGVVTGLASVITDISEQKRTAADLEKARLAAEAAVRAKSRFLANMSHELRTPLNGVVGMASLLEGSGLDAKQRQFVRTLRSSAESLVTLINDVLDLSKVEAGKLTLARTQFRVRDEIEQIANLFSARAYEKHIELAAHVGRDIPASMLGDPGRLRQVLGNLVNNAIKFTESGAVLLTVDRATTEAGEPALEFSVHDTGVGVAPDEQKRIFEAFEQADDSTTRKFGGTGLGLAISRQLIELMQGSVGLESDLGRGSRFYFRLPIGLPQPASPLATPSDDLGIVLIGMHPLILRAVRESFATEAMHVSDARSPGKAIEELGKLGANIRRVRVFLEASTTTRLRETVDGLRIAAAPRPVEVIVLVPPDAEPVRLAGVNRCIIKPLLTHDLLPAPAAPRTGAGIAPAERGREQVARGARGHALLVEDNAVNQEMTRAMLELLGFRVTIASNGLEGVKAAAADPPPDLILMDCQMPVMDGLDATRAIRAAEPAGRRVAILALTGNSQPAEIQACLSAGMDDCLVKPFSLSALRELLERWAPGTVVSSELASTGS